MRAKDFQKIVIVHNEESYRYYTTSWKLCAKRTAEHLPKEFPCVLAWNFTQERPLDGRYVPAVMTDVKVFYIREE